MNIKKFYGKNAREALAKVKAELGINAVIISNKSVDNGVEILAASESDIQQASSVAANKSLSNRNSAENASNSEVSFVDLVAQNKLYARENKQDTTIQITMTETEPPASEANEKTLSEAKYETKVEEYVAPIQTNAPALSIAQGELEAITETIDQKMQGMMLEMRNMRSHFESQMVAMTWQHHVQHNPAKSKVLSTLLAASFSASLSRQIAEKLPNHIDTKKAAEWAKEIVARNLHTIEDENQILDRGGIYALVGPTGVGKTTTTAKLAARYVMRHGTQNLGLITTDSYRIGGHEQLRIYGKILGVMVHAVKDEEELRIALKELKNKHMILVDTVGLSQRDQALTEQLAMFNQNEATIHKLLCLNATCTGETLTDVLSAYKKHNITGAIITKLDEAAAIGNVLDVIIRERMRLFYVTSGQRVPEDIAVADKQALVDQALTFSNASWPYQYLEEELPLVVSNMQISEENTTQPANIKEVSNV